MGINPLKYSQTEHISIFRPIFSIFQIAWVDFLMHTPSSIKSINNGSFFASQYPYCCLRSDKILFFDAACLCRVAILRERA